MPIFYKLVQDKRLTSTTKGMWFARAIATNTVDTNALAEIMQRNCTVKKSDILAVLAELVETMTDQLQQSAKIKLTGFGSFKLGIRGVGSSTVKDYSVLKNVRGLRVNFQPEWSKDSNGNRSKKFLDGATVTEAPKNAVVEEEETTKP